MVRKANGGHLAGDLICSRMHTSAAHEQVYEDATSTTDGIKKEMERDRTCFPRCCDHNVFVVNLCAGTIVKKQSEMLCWWLAHKKGYRNNGKM